MVRSGSQTAPRQWVQPNRQGDHTWGLSVVRRVCTLTIDPSLFHFRQRAHLSGQVVAEMRETLNSYLLRGICGGLRRMARPFGFVSQRKAMDAALSGILVLITCSGVSTCNLAHLGAFAFSVLLRGAFSPRRQLKLTRRCWVHVCLHSFSAEQVTYLADLG
ncbi:hypothetical protein EV126DRAFT_417358, partial [Verticillium dahliae]